MVVQIQIYKLPILLHFNVLQQQRQKTYLIDLSEIESENTRQQINRSLD